jgi:hypothetical protein
MIKLRGPEILAIGERNGREGDLTLTIPPAKRAFRFAETPFDEYREADLPLESFCALAHGAQLLIRPAGPTTAPEETGVSLAASDGELAPMLAEACTGVAPR